MTRMRLSFSLFLCASLLAAAVPAASQQRGLGSSALKGHNVDAPIDIDAARIEVRDRDNQALFSGQVRVRQAELGLDAQQLRVFYDHGAGEALQIRRLDAEGGVRLSSPSEQATAAYGVYDVDQRQLTMIGNVVLTRGDSILRGQRLAIDLESGRSTLDGATGGSSGASRVTGRFVVPARRSTTP